MDLLKDYVDNNALSKTSILKYVDDYSIYSFYIGAELELYTKYSSPLRQGDDDPSFSLYYSKYVENKIFFKDQSTGKTGDVFTFLLELMKVDGEFPPIKRVLLQINSDFGLGLNDEEVGEFKPQLIKKAPLKKDPVKIEITKHIKSTEAFIEYWKSLDISTRTQKKFYASDVRVIHYKNADSHITIVASTLTISYEIVGHYKVYQPFAERKYKFRNDYLDVFVEGALQLEFKQNFAIITKSTKECMFFYEHFKWEAVAGKSENTPINPYFMDTTLKKQYKYVFIWLDNDEAGINAQQRYLEEYPWLIPIVVDKFVKEKDVTDFYLAKKAEGKQDVALAYIKFLIETKLDKLNGRISN